MTRARETGDFGHLTHLRNEIIDGAFECWDEDTSLALIAGSEYTATLWKGREGTGGTGTHSRQTFTPGQTDVPNEPEYYLRHDQTVGANDTTEPRMQHLIEDVRTLAGQKAALSFWAKSDTAITLTPTIRQAFGTSGSASVDTVGSGISITTSWAKHKQIIDIPSISGKTIDDTDCHIKVYLGLPLNTVFTFDITQVQLEAERVTPFEVLPISEIRVLVSRYYENSYNPGDPVGTATNDGTIYERVGTSISNTQSWRYHPIQRKRSIPTVAIYDNTGSIHSSWSSISNNYQTYNLQNISGGAISGGTASRYHHVVDARF